MIHFNHKSKGFSLVELLVVVSILSLLTSVTYSATDNVRARARDSKRMGDLRQIELALEQYYLDHEAYPPYSTVIPNQYSSGCAETQITGCGNCNRWCLLRDDLAPYLELPTDPLNSEYDPEIGFHYGYTSNAGNGYQTYGVYAILESDHIRADNDGGYYPSIGGGVTHLYERGSQVAYCMDTYMGSNRDWFGNKGVSETRVCSGGN